MSAGTWPTRQTGTVTPPTGGAAAYAYDALGRITTKTIGTSVDTYSYLGSTETAWQIVNTGGSGITTKSALDATGARTAVTNGNALTGYLGFDLHGNTALAENGSKVITDALRYDAWGELIASTTSALPTPWRYQGRLDVGPDAANPLYDFGARDYRPVTGAFTSLDSYAGQVIDPLSMNRFLYAEANPATFVDPDGHGVDSGIGNCMPTCPADVKAAAAAAAKAKQAAADDAIEIAYITKKAGGAADFDVLLPPPGTIAPIDDIGAMSIGQLLVYLQNRAECGSSIQMAVGCTDYRYAYCTLGNSVGSSFNDCLAYAEPTRLDALDGPVGTLIVAPLAAAGLAYLGPGIWQWYQTHPDQVAQLPQVVQNAIRGRLFQNAGINWLRVTENFRNLPGLDRLGNMINIRPDSLTRGFIEFKDVLRLSDARGQISAMADAARTAGQQLNIFVSPRIGGLQNVSKTVLQAVQGTGGNIWMLDPKTGFIQQLYGPIGGGLP